MKSTFTVIATSLLTTLIQAQSCPFQKETLLSPSQRNGSYTCNAGGHLTSPAQTFASWNISSVNDCAYHCKQQRVDSEFGRPCESFGYTKENGSAPYYEGLCTMYYKSLTQMGLVNKNTYEGTRFANQACFAPVNFIENGGFEEADPQEPGGVKAWKFSVPTNKRVKYEFGRSSSVKHSGKYSFKVTFGPGGPDNITLTPYFPPNCLEPNQRYELTFYFKGDYGTEFASYVDGKQVSYFPCEYSECVTGFFQASNSFLTGTDDDAPVTLQFQIARTNSSSTRQTTVYVDDLVLQPFDFF